MPREGEVQPAYRVIQLEWSAARGFRNEEVDDLDSLVTHHPQSNRAAHLQNGIVIDGQRDRQHALIGGEIQEIQAARPGRTYGLQPDQVLLKKDFMLEDSRLPTGPGSRTLDIPSPIAGVIGNVDARQGLADILDQEGGAVIARIRHMAHIRVQPGDAIEYGQAVGTQGTRQADAIHVHMEVDTRYYQHYESYMEDLVSGRLSIDPVRQTQGIEARPIVDDGVIRIGDSAEIVRRVQQQLNDEGFRGADNQPLQVDGVYRLSMQAAVINFQQAHGLPQTGDIDVSTLQQIAPRVFPPAYFREAPGDGANPGIPLYMNRHGAGLGNDPPPDVIDDPILSQAERAVRQLDRNSGREYDDQSACMAASAACLAKAKGLSRIDHIFLSEARGSTRKGENLFVVQGAPGDPAHLRAQMKTQDAIDMPVEKSLGQLHALDEIPQPSQSLQMDEAVRQTGPQMRLS